MDRELDPNLLADAEEFVEEVSLRPATLADYVGQRGVVDNLTIFLKAAKLRGEAMDHVLFAGPPGLGKTTLANVIANEMGVAIKATSGPVIERGGDLAAIVSNLEEGDILFIESTQMSGRGDLKLTGSMGDVMRESVEAARSWLRNHAGDFALEAETFDEHDVHVRVPQGAVPKDGPSAGIGMVSSLASLMTGRAIRPRVAMTGEITLRGKVLPVGGIKEKVLAAKRAGIARVVLPERNRRDIEEINDGLLDGLDLQFVGTIDEALRHTLSAEDLPSA